MKKLSKMVSLLLAAVMVLSVVGCGKPADKTTGTQGKARHKAAARKIRKTPMKKS